jgi:hypothetical protein
MFLNSIKGRIVKAINKVRSIISKGGNARVLHKGDKLKDDEIYFEGIAIPIPDDISKESVNFSENITDSELAMMITHVIQRPEEQMRNEEPYDDVLDPTPSPITVNNKPILPDGWSVAYYPAGGETGGKPHIPSIKEWVENVKLNHMTTQDLKGEYGKTFGKKTPNTWDKKMMERMVDSIAFMVARKIWYVGRKPSSMSDGDWDKATRDKRPSEGSFSKNEHWSNGFPYGDGYTYKSWGHQEIMELKNTGKLKW